MGAHVITDTFTPRAAQRARTRALVVPREHGAWGLLLIPLCTGAAVGIGSTQIGWLLVPFTTAALALFWLRTPVESLLGTTPLSVQTPAERRISMLIATALAAISVGSLAILLWSGRNRGLLLLGGIAAAAFVVQTFLNKMGRKVRMAAQIVGAIGLTCTAPAAYYVASGSLGARAWVLWAANWAFAGNQIHFVQLRIHAARAASFSEKFARGKLFFLDQIIVLPLLAIASRSHLIPGLTMLAFLPSLARGFHWFFREHDSLHVRSLGWSEMRQGILFGILLTGAFLLS